MSEPRTVRHAAIGAAALGPAIGAIPYWLYFAAEVASRGSGSSDVLAGVAAAALYVPIVLIAAYIAGVVPAAVVGGSYAYALRRWPRLGRTRAWRTLGAATIAFVVCLLWTLSFGQLTILEFVGKALWPVVGCGVFAAIVLANFGADRRAAA
jgi:hypothetical protein